MRHAAGKSVSARQRHYKRLICGIADTTGTARKFVGRYHRHERYLTNLIAVSMAFGGRFPCTD